MKLKCLRTPSHVGNAWHRPLGKIAIERYCPLKRCSNHSIARLQQRKKKRQRKNTKRKKKIGNNILVWYSLLDTKMENYKEQYTNNKRRQRIEIEMVTYWLPCWLHWTPPTSKHHYWTLMPLEMLFKPFSNKNTEIKKRDKNKYQRRRKSEIILVIYSYNNTENY